MKKFFLVLLSACCFMACKKDHLDTKSITPADESSKIKTASTDNQLTSYTYDEQGRQLNKNIVKSTQAQLPDGSNNASSNFVYEYDLAGHVSKMTVTTGSDVEIGIFTYY